jgi:hypothetical protein
MRRGTTLILSGLLAGSVATAVSALAAGTSGPSAATFGAPAGGSAAYHGVLVKQSSPKVTPANRAVAYDGPQLELAEAYVGRKAAEPTLGVDKKGAVYTVAADFDAIPGSPKNEPRTLVERSLDGGRTFQVAQPEVGGQNTHPASLDPYIYVDPDYGRIFDIDLALAGSELSYSDDQGKTWFTSALTSAGPNDHQTLVTGVVPEGSGLVTLDPAFPKIVYYCVNEVVMGACARSLDGGKTFVQANQTGYQAFRPTDVATLNQDRNFGICGSLHGHAVTDRQGRLFIPRGYCNQPFIAISNDGGTTFHDVAVSTGVTASGTQGAVAVDKAGNLYFSWFDTDHHLPYLATSTDHGEHWSTPRMIAPPGVHEVNFPSIDVGDPGRVVVTFPGTTAVNAKDPNTPPTDLTRPWNSYVVISTDALSANPLFLSATSNPKWDPVARGDCNGRCGRMYDFLDVVSAPADSGRVFATMVDTCTAQLKCKDARVPGNWNSDDVVQEETAHDYGASNDMQEVVIRQVSGPALRGKSPITRDTAR